MKSQLEHRPLLLAFAAIAVGLSCATHWFNVVFLLPVLYLAASLRLRVILGLLGLLGVLIAPEPLPEVHDKTPFHGIVRVSSIPRVFSTSVAFEVDGYRKYLVRMNPGTTVNMGDMLEIEGELGPFRESEEEYQRSAGRVGVIVPESLSIHKEAVFWWRWGGSWRQSFLAYAAKNLEPAHAATLDALCFNATWYLAEDDWKNLRRSGTIHIISASGLHVMILALGLALGFSKLPLPRVLQLLLTIAVLILFACAAGRQHAILRSVLMVSVGYGAYLFRREPDWLSLVGLSGCLVLLTDPRGIYDLGFQLSYVLVAGLAMFVPWIAPDASLTFLERKQTKMRSIFVASVWAAVIVAPLSAYYFGGLSLVSPFANLLIAPLIPFVMIMAMGSHLTSFVVPGFGPLILQVTDGLVSILRTIVYTMGELPFAYVDVPDFSAYWMLPYYAALMLGYWRFHARPA